MRQLKFLCCVVIFFNITSLLFAQTTPLQNKREGLSFNLQATFNLKLPFQPDKFLIQTLLAIPELGLKGDINFQLISTAPLAWKLTASYLQIETASLLTNLQKLGYVNKKLTLPLKGNLILNQITLKAKGTHYIFDFKKAIFPPLYGLKQIVLQNVHIETKEKNITWQIGRFCIDKTIFTNLSGAYTQAELKVTLANATLDISSLLNALLKFDLSLKKKLLAQITVYPLKDVQIAGQLSVNNLQVSLEQKDKNFLFKSAQARIRTVKPVVISLFPSFSQKTGHISLQTQAIDFVYTENKGRIKTQKLDIAIKDVDYLPHIKDLPFKKVSLTAELSATNLNLNLEQKNKKVILHTCQGDINITKPLILTLFSPSFKPALIHLTMPSMHFIWQTQNTSFQIQSLEITATDFTYPLAPKEIITLNGGFIFQNAQVTLNKEKLTAVFNFQHKPTTLKWHDKTFSFKQLSGHLDYTPNKIKLTNLQTEISVSPKGFIKLGLNGQWPFDFSLTQIDLLVQELEFYPLYLQHIVLKKTIGGELKANYALEVADLAIKGESRINQQKEKILVITPTLAILPKKKLAKTTAPKRIQAETQPKPFDFSWTKTIAQIAPKWHLEFDNITYADFSPLETLKMDVIFQEPTNQLALSTYACGLSIYGGCNFTTTSLNCFTEVKASSLPLDHLLGCFIHEAPVYVTGNTTLQFTASTHGQSNKELIDNAQVEGLVTIENGQIMKLSNLHKSLGFILDILHIVRLNPSKLHDALPFDNILCTVKGTSKEVNFKNIRFISPVLQFFAEGSYKIDRQIFTLNGRVEKGFVKKDFSIEKNLKE